VARAIPKGQWEEYRELIVALNLLTPNKLEGKVIQMDRTAVAAAA
jgi:hypothetical protein